MKNLFIPCGFLNMFCIISDFTCQLSRRLAASCMKAYVMESVNEKVKKRIIKS